MEETHRPAQPLRRVCLACGVRILEEREKELIRRAAQGEARALHQLVEEHARHLFGTACAMMGRTADAEDVVQETLLAAVRGIGKFDGRSSLRTWLVAILIRQAALWRRRRGRPMGQLDELAPPPAPSPPRHTAAADAQMDVGQMLQTLSPEHREVLVLREYEGMSYEEIAASLGLPRGTVESRLHRARQQLRSRLSGYG